MTTWGKAAALLAAGALLLSGCDQDVDAADQGGKTTSQSKTTGQSGKTGKADACTEALGLADLNPLIDPAKLKARAEEKGKRLRELAGDVQDQNVKNALVDMADSYVEVKKEHIEDAGVVAQWVKRNVKNLDALRAACD